MRLEIISEKPVGVSRQVPVRFVHGMWSDAWCWAEHFMPYFAQHGYESFALSLRGHGDSERVENIRRVTLKDYLHDLEDVTGRFERPPVLVLGAGNDMIMSAGDVYATGRRYDVEAVIFPDMAHCMMIEHAWQEVADRIIGWLAGCGI